MLPFFAAGTKVGCENLASRSKNVAEHCCKAPVSRICVNKIWGLINENSQKLSTVFYNNRENKCLPHLLPNFPIYVK